MAYLSFQEMEALRTGDDGKAAYARDLQGRMIGKHLAAFALKLAEKVEPNAKTLFYKTIAAILRLVFTPAA